MARKRPPPSWQVDPSWPAVPPRPDHAPAENGAPTSPLADRRAQRVRDLAAEVRRLTIELHRTQRALEAARTAASAPSRGRGNPGHPLRNDRLLSLFEKTPAHLSRLQRCAMAAQRYAREFGGRLMPTTTARDAIAEARKRNGTR